MRKLLAAILLLLMATPADAIDLSITATNVVAGANSNINHGLAGVAITAGQAIYLDAADNKLKLADNNAATPAIAEAVGVALNSGGVNQTIAYITSGDFNPGATLVVGTTYIVSGTPGGIAPAADLASGMRLTYIGYGATTNTLRLNLKATGVQVP